MCVCVCVCVMPRCGPAVIKRQPSAHDKMVLGRVGTGLECGGVAAVSIMYVALGSCQVFLLC